MTRTGVTAVTSFVLPQIYGKEGGWGLQKETQLESGGKAAGDRAWCHSPCFVPLMGAGWAKTLLQGRCFCAGVLGEAGVRGGTKGAGGGQGLPPQPHTLGIWTRRASCGAGALRLLEHIGVPVMEAQQNQGLPPALGGERTQHLL